MSATATFAAGAVALYAAHHVGDYWVQTDHQAAHKGAPGPEGRRHCVAHVLTYLATQFLCLALVTLVTGLDTSPLGLVLALAVSGVTHYVADRRAPLKRIASWIPGKARFVQLGVPRANEGRPGAHIGSIRVIAHDDPPQLATGLWALDQSWHIFWGVFVAALLLCI